MSLLDSIVSNYIKKQSVMLSVCTHRTIDIDVLTSVMNLFGTKDYSITWCPIRGDALISRARSRVASYFLKQRKEDILFFLDDDIVFSKDDVLKVLHCITHYGADIAGAMYVQKGTLDKTCVLFENDNVKFSKESKPCDVQALATGFMAIHRRVLEKMATEGEKMEYPEKIEHDDILDYYNFFNPFIKKLNDGRKTELSEDWAFCERSRKLGFQVMLDPSVFLGHKGEYVYDLGDKVRLKDKKMSLNDLSEKFEITLK